MVLFFLPIFTDYLLYFSYGIIWKHSPQNNVIRLVQVLITCSGNKYSYLRDEFACLDDPTM